VWRKPTVSCASDVIRASGERWATRLSALSSPSPVFPTTTNPSAMQTPIAELSITEDGGVKKVRLLRSSNQQSWDRAILKTLKTWRFSKADPGCGLTKVSIDIHAQ